MQQRNAIAVGLTALVVLVGVAVWAAAGRSEPSCSTPRERIETVVYADRDGASPELTSLDVHASPDAADCPVLVWVHGGSWQAGDKATRLTTVKADHFIEDGWVFVSVNYRLAAEDNDVRWPAFGDDVASAIGWVQSEIGRFGGDPDRISLMGHSSGAHLVSIAATSEALLGRADLGFGDLRCVVSLDSVTHDLTDPPPWEVDIVELAFPTTADRAAGSPTLQVAESAPPPPAFLIVTRGRPERLESSDRLAEAIRGVGGEAEVADVSPYDHAQVSTELGVPGESIVTPVVDAFLDDCR